MVLSQEDTQRFLSEPRNVILGTIRKDGSPQLNPMWFDWNGVVYYGSTRHEMYRPRQTPIAR